MNRNPSTTIQPVKASGILPPIGNRKAAFAGVMEAGRAAFPNMSGLTCIDRSRAFFQVSGDAGFYSVAITSAEADALGYMSL